MMIFVNVNRTGHFIHSFISCKQKFFFEEEKKINFAIESIALAAKRNSHHFFWVLVFSINPLLIYEHRIQTIELFIEDLMNDISLSVCVYEPDFFFQFIQLDFDERTKEKKSISNQSADKYNIPPTSSMMMMMMWSIRLVYLWMKMVNNNDDNKNTGGMFFLNEMEKKRKKSYFVLDLTWIACISFFFVLYLFLLGGLAKIHTCMNNYHTHTHTHLIHQNELIF